MTGHGLRAALRVASFESRQLLARTDDDLPGNGRVVVGPLLGLLVLAVFVDQAVLRQGIDSGYGPDTAAGRLAPMLGAFALYDLLSRLSREEAPELGFSWLARLPIPGWTVLLGQNIGRVLSGPLPRLGTGVGLGAVLAGSDDTVSAGVLLTPLLAATAFELLVRPWRALVDLVGPARVLLGAAAKAGASVARLLAWGAVAALGILGGGAAAPLESVSAWCLGLAPGGPTGSLLLPGALLVVAAALHQATPAAAASRVPPVRRWSLPQPLFVLGWSRPLRFLLDVAAASALLLLLRHVDLRPGPVLWWLAIAAPALLLSQRVGDALRQSEPLVARLPVSLVRVGRAQLWGIVPAVALSTVVVALLVDAPPTLAARIGLVAVGISVALLPLHAMGWLDLTPSTVGPLLTAGALGFGALLFGGVIRHGPGVINCLVLGAAGLTWTRLLARGAADRWSASEQAGPDGLDALAVYVAALMIELPVVMFLVLFPGGLTEPVLAGTALLRLLLATVLPCLVLAITARRAGLALPSAWTGRPRWWLLPLLLLAGAAVQVAAATAMGFDDIPVVDLVSVESLRKHLAAPLAEEWVFRGVMLGALVPVLGGVRAVVLTTVVFVGVHVSGAWQPLAVVGAVAGVVALRRGLAPAAAFHVGANVMHSVIGHYLQG